VATPDEHLNRNSATLSRGYYDVGAAHNGVSAPELLRASDFARPPDCADVVIVPT